MADANKRFEAMGRVKQVEQEFDKLAALIAKMDAETMKIFLNKLTPEKRALLREALENLRVDTDLGIG